MKITMKKFLIGFIASLLLLPALGAADEAGNTAPLSGTAEPAQLSSESSRTDQQAQEDNTSKEPAPDLLKAEPAKQEEPVVGEKPVLPPAIPPPASFTPEQIKAFFSKPKEKEKDYIILNFDNAELRDVINTISSITGENFILSPGLDARVTIHSVGKIPTSEALSVFESILEVNGMGLIKSGRFYKIVLSSAAKQKSIEVQKGREAEGITSVDRSVTQIVQVQYVPAAEISKILQPMLSQFGSIIPNPRNNLLIINDIASNIKRILIILKEIDVNAFQNTRMGFFQPRYSDVKTIADELAEIIDALNLGRDGTVAMVPIERINSLVVFSSSPRLLETIENWFKKLDEEVTTGQNIFVYSVQNVKAESIASILKTVYETGDTATARRTPRATTPSRQRKRPQTSALIRPGTKVEIVTFEPTNSLVILAPPGIYREMVETIKKLDVYPQEVLIEVLIAEVTLTGREQFGIQWSVLNDVHIEGNTFTELIQSRSGQTEVPSYNLPLTLGTGSAAASLISGGFSYLLYKPGSLIALLHALASEGRVNILSSPRLLVRNQEEASIEVGSDIPTATSSTAATTGISTLTQNIEYKTIGVKLKIKPSINDEKTVVLDIEQEVSDQLTNVAVGQAGFTYPAFSTRKTKTSVIIPDKQSIVIGGIIKERTEESYQGIPVLSSIPILGNLFRYTVDTSTKTELIIILTPHVITNKTEADVITMQFMEKLKEVKKFLKKFKDMPHLSVLEEDKSTQANEQ